jgi:hypothetical protein
MKIEVMDAAAHTDNIASNTILKKEWKWLTNIWRMVFLGTGIN